MFACRRHILLAVVGAAFAVSSLAMASAPEPESSLSHPHLGPAPVRHEVQDASGWKAAPKSARSRHEVVQLYNTLYLGIAPSMGWTGSVASCDPGSINDTHQQATIDRINFYRAMADLPFVVLVSGAVVDEEQAGALVMSANGALSHAPTPSWNCFSTAALKGAGQSNLALGANGTTAVDWYMDDSGPNNAAVGHRRWLLFPPRTGMATGDVSGSPGHLAANAIFVFGPAGPRPSTPAGVAWPPSGYVPYNVLPSTSNRWSFSYPGADFGAATVSVTSANGTHPASIEPVQNGYGDNTLVFKPSNIAYAKPFSDTSYVVQVQGVQGVNVPSAFSYTVTVIDPAQLVASSPFVDIPTGHWAYSQIDAIYRAGITKGCALAPLRYCPSEPVTREQMAAFIVRAIEGEADATLCNSGSPFDDVDPGSPFCAAIRRLSELGITAGCEQAKFCPSAIVTREQMAAFLVRAMEGEPDSNLCGAGSGFNDVPANSPFCNYIARLAHLGVTSGCGIGIFCPSAAVSRDQMAVFIARAFL